MGRTTSLTMAAKLAAGTLFALLPVLVLAFAGPWAVLNGQNRQARLLPAEAKAIGIFPLRTAAVLAKACDTMVLIPREETPGPDLQAFAKANEISRGQWRRLLALNAEDGGNSDPIVIDDFSQDTVLRDLVALIMGSGEFAALAATYNIVGLPLELQAALAEELIRWLLTEGGLGGNVSSTIQGPSGQNLLTAGQNAASRPVGGFTSGSGSGGGAAPLPLTSGADSASNGAGSGGTQ